MQHPKILLPPALAAALPACIIVDGRPFLRTTQDVPFDLFGKTPVVMLMSGPPAGVLLENYGLLVVTPNGAVGTDQLFYPLAPPRF